MAVSEHRKALLRNWCKRNPERRFMRYLRARLKGKYGLTPETFNALLVKQDYRCAICGGFLEVPTPTNRIRNGRSVVVDHIKGTKTVRGLLHNNCNRALGLFNDNATTLRFAAFYLDKGSDKE